jgi:hypothetical protein
MSTTKEIALEYFIRFMNRDASGLRGMFTPDVSLTDWEHQASGIDAVLDINTQLFAAVDDIKIQPIKLLSDFSTVAAEIAVTVTIGDAATVINVVDVLQITDGKISSITAYKR